MNAIEVRNLTKKFSPPRGLMKFISKSPLKNEIVAVDRISFAVEEGEIFAVAGPNGAGKTTLIKILCTLLFPSSGKALVNGHDVQTEEEKVKASVGLSAGEERSFYWRLTGRENLAFFASLQNMPKTTANKRITEVLHQISLEDAADNMFYSYSAGMKQKLVIGRALLSNPKILFLDEPTKSVDPVTAHALRKLIRNKLVGEQKRTVFLASHHLEEVEELCDRIAVMHQGRITFCGTTDDFKRTIRSSDHYILEVANIMEDKLAEIANHKNLADISIAYVEDSCLRLKFVSGNGGDPVSPLLRDILDKGGAIHSCIKSRPKLEEAFIKHLDKMDQRANIDATEEAQMVSAGNIKK